MSEATTPTQTRSFRRHFQNWISWAGMVLAAAALFAFVLLFAIDFFAPAKNPYIGILAYVIAPFFFLLGLTLTVFGAILHRREERHAAKVEKKHRILQIGRASCRERP